MVNMKRNINFKTGAVAKWLCERDSRFFEAAMANDIQTLERLLKFGLDVNSKEKKHGDTAMHIAIKRRYFDTVFLLFRYGASPLIFNNNGRSAAEEAAIQFAHDCLALHWDEVGISTQDAEEHQRLQHGLLSILEGFRGAGMVLNAKYSRHRSIVEHILPYANKDLVKFFINLKYDFHTADRITNRPMLHCLTGFGNDEAAEALLLHVNINGLMDTDTPLHRAAHYGFDKCARLFAINGCSVDIVNDENKTALHTAFSSKELGSAQVFWDLLVNFRSGVNSIVRKNSGLLDLICRSTLSEIDAMDTEKLLTLVRHLIAMKEAKFSVPAAAVLLILMNEQVRQRLKVLSFLDQCAQEIQELKATRLCADINMFDLIIKDASETSWYINDKVCEYFESGKYQCQFPIYCDSLRIAFNLALERQKLVDESEAIYCDILSQFKVPYPALRIIMNNLDNTNLACVANSC